MLSTMLVSGATVVATFSLPSCSVKLSSVPDSPAPGLELLLDEHAARSSRASSASATERRQVRGGIAADIASPLRRSVAGIAARCTHYTTQLQAVAIASLRQSVGLVTAVRMA